VCACVCVCVSQRRVFVRLVRVVVVVPAWPLAEPSPPSIFKIKHKHSSILFDSLGGGEISVRK
jgi:hypothetical protein